MSFEHRFRCPLAQGLHARPASRLAELAARFSAEVELVNERNGASANAKSALALIALELRAGDPCVLRVRGAEAEEAFAALRSYAEREFARSDDPGAGHGASGEAAAHDGAPASAASTASVDSRVPRALRGRSGPVHAGARVSPGTGIGRVVVVRGLALPPELEREPAQRRSLEERRVARALRALRAELERAASAADGLSAELLRAHLAIAGDPELEARLAAELARGRSAGQAIVAAAAHFAERLARADSPYVRERALDVEDLGLQLLEQVYGARAEQPPIRLDGQSVLVAEQLAPRQLLALDRSALAALVLERAAQHSHTAILARSFEIPTVSGVEGLRALVAPGEPLCVDATLGLVFRAPTPAVLRHCERSARHAQSARRRLAQHPLAAEENGVRPAIARTRDGQALELAANVSSTAEVAPAFDAGASAIGLFRTEMLYLGRAQPPSEEEQFASYRAALRAARGAPLVVRSFDLGGDKQLGYLGLPREGNPYLGRRGLRLYAAHPDLLEAQLCALLRVALEGELWLLVPFVASAADVLAMRASVRAASRALEARGLPHARELRVGAMIELPCAAFDAERIAAAADFLSIGTNDLAQYVFAAERGNAAVAALADPHQPVFLRLLQQIVRAARAQQRWIGVCGEFAGEPAALPLLVGLGLDELSCAAPAIPALRRALGELDSSACRALLERALACSDAREVGELLRAAARAGAAPELLEADCAALELECLDKAEALSELAGLMVAAGRAADASALEEALWAREELSSTGLGHGFAVPHCKSDAVLANTIAVVRLREPVDWNAIDGQGVRCVVLLALRANEPSDTHLRVFAKLARKLVHAPFREQLLGADCIDDLLGALARELELSVPARR
jgi:phosphoenolpyruvate-protein phosphotransferase